MNWLTFALLAWVALGLELSLSSAFSLGGSGVAPNLLVCVVTLVAMFARARQAYWAALVLGLLADLTFLPPVRDGVTPMRIVGPHVLAFAAGVAAVMSMRTAVIRRNPLTLGFLSMVCGISAALVVTAVLEARSWALGDLNWGFWQQLWPRLGSALYTGLVAAVLGALILPLAPLLGLRVGQTMISRRSHR